MRRFGPMLVMLVTLFTVVASAQINTGKISGFVTDPSGAFIAGVTVTATNDGTGVVTKAQTSETGEYLLNFLVPGTYHVEAEQSGFQKAVESQVVVNAGGIVRADFPLRVAISCNP